MTKKSEDFRYSSELCHVFFYAKNLFLFDAVRGKTTELRTYTTK